VGHKSGADHSGARGAKPAMAHPSLVAQAEGALAELRESAQDEAREYAQNHKLGAVKKIVSIMRNRKTPKSVARACARDVIEIADGKVGGIQEKGAKAGGLTVNIYNLSTGQVEPKRIEKEVKAFEERIVQEDMEIPAEEQTPLREPDFVPDAGR